MGDEPVLALEYYDAEGDIKIMHLRSDGTHETIRSRGHSLNYPDPGPHAVLLSVYRQGDRLAHMQEEDHGVYVAVGLIKNDDDPEADPLDCIAEVLADPVGSYKTCLAAFASARASARRSGSVSGRVVQ